MAIRPEPELRHSIPLGLVDVSESEIVRVLALLRQETDEVKATVTARGGRGPQGFDEAVDLRELPSGRRQSIRLRGKKKSYPDGWDVYVALSHGVASVESVGYSQTGAVEARSLAATVADILDNRSTRLVMTRLALPVVGGAAGVTGSVLTLIYVKRLDSALLGAAPYAFLLAVALYALSINRSGARLLIDTQNTRRTSRASGRQQILIGVVIAAVSAVLAVAVTLVGIKN
jgi:hypothetical protein